MEVLLWQDVPNLGDRGEVVTVKDGYARNYLFPRRLASPPTSSYRNQMEFEKRRVVKAEEQAQANLAEWADKLTELGSVTIEALANNDGHLFGSVGATDIATALEAEGIPVPARAILLEESIRETGVNTVAVELDKENPVELKVWVIDAKDKSDAAPEDTTSEEAPSEEEATAE